MKSSYCGRKRTFILSKRALRARRRTHCFDPKRTRLLLEPVSAAGGGEQARFAKCKRLAVEVDLIALDRDQADDGLELEEPRAVRYLELLFEIERQEDREVVGGDWRGAIRQVGRRDRIAVRVD